MSTADELAKLDALRKSGVLTPEEFDAEKARLLATPLPPPPLLEDRPEPHKGKVERPPLTGLPSLTRYANQAR